MITRNQQPNEEPRKQLKQQNELNSAQVNGLNQQQQEKSLQGAIVN